MVCMAIGSATGVCYAKQLSHKSVIPILLIAKPESVLLIGRCGFGLADEILKYRDVRKSDCIEPDPEMTDFLRRNLPAIMKVRANFI